MDESRDAPGLRWNSPGAAFTCVRWIVGPVDPPGRLQPEQTATDLVEAAGESQSREEIQPW
jgi:hypothetical protein